MIYHDAQLHNVAELIPAPNQNGQLPVRVPNSLRLQLNQSAQNNALQCAGCELRFNLKGSPAELTLATIVPNNWNMTHSIVEVYQGDFQTAWFAIDATPTVLSISRPEYQNELPRLSQHGPTSFDPELTRVILPYRPSIALIDLQGDLTPPSPDQIPSTKYLAYGSSITHGHVSVRPTETWAMQTAQALGVDLINLGFGGGAHLEPQIADYIAQRPDWHMATLEMGINVLSTFSVEEFTQRVDYFIERIARSHPDKWIFCIDMFRFLRPNLIDHEKCKGFRDIVRNKVRSLNLPRLKHISGLDLLPQPQGLNADLVHPSPLGMAMIKERLAPIIRSAISTACPD